MAKPPFRIVIFDKNLVRKGPVGRPLTVTATPRHAALQTCSWEVDDDHPRAADMIAAGGRAIVYYDGDFLMSGTIDGTSAQGPLVNATRTFQLVDDLQLLWTILGWQVPGAAITAQNTAEYDVATGPAETVVKDLVAANAARLGIAIDIAPDLGRGGTIDVSTRMHTLADRLVLASDLAGIGITIRQIDGVLVLDCYEKSVYGHTLTVRSGVVTRYSHTTAAPTATRVVVAAGGEALARVYRRYVDAAREAAWGVIREIVVDARDISPTDPNFEARCAARGAEALAAGAPTSGLSVTLAETPFFRYGRAVKVGDTVPVDIGGRVITDVLTSAEIKWRTGSGDDSGLTVAPQIGAITDSPDEALASAIRATADRVNRLSAER